MGLTYVTVALCIPGSSAVRYSTEFLVDTGATDTLAPASELHKAGIRPIGKTVYERANGSVVEYDSGLTQIEFMGEVTAGRVIFGPDGSKPLLGVTALESVGILVDPARPTQAPSCDSSQVGGWGLPSSLVLGSRPHGFESMSAGAGPIGVVLCVRT
jgi:clan AA aspartic protease